MDDLRPYVVNQGESLATLSQRDGLDIDAVWQHPANEHLRSKRTDPCVLAPYDVVFLPPPKRTWLPVKVGETNVFFATVRKLHARIRCVDDAGAAIAGVTYEVADLHPAQIGQTATDGGIDLEVPSNVATIRIRFPDAGMEILAHVGHLNPVREESGAEQRLAALGIGPPLPAVLDEGVRELVRAEYRGASLAAFQQTKGLEATGTLDDATAKALLDAHGA